MIGPNRTRAISKAKFAPVSDADVPNIANAAKPAAKLQATDGVTLGKTKGGSKLNLSIRKDGFVWKQQLAALKERAQTARSPEQRMVFQAAYNRLAAVEAQKG
jgi:hypothetical protein